VLPSEDLRLRDSRERLAPVASGCDERPAPRRRADDAVFLPPDLSTRRVPLARAAFLSLGVLWIVTPSSIRAENRFSGGPSGSPPLLGILVT
jgi:hypothetical protein